MTVEPRRSFESRLSLVIGFLIIGVALFFVASRLPVNRTQEARVVVTAEEMVDQPLDDWLVPKMNGKVRLKKPPLAYWWSAISIDIFGPSDFSARVPAVLASWGTVGLTFLIARRLFNQRAALFAALSLLGSRLFFKQATLAETDVLICVFMTGSIWCALKIADMQNQSRVANVRWLLALLAVLIACTVLAKGPQALLILLTLIGFDLVRHRLGERSWKSGIVAQFFTSGAVLLALFLALPWFLFAISQPGSEQLGGDLSNSAGGGKGHSAPFWAYFAMLSSAMLPWTIVWFFALFISYLLLRRPIDHPDLKIDIDMTSERRSLWLLVVWGCAFFVPLLFWGNKQIHYLLPLMPATMISVGWMLDRALRLRRDLSSRCVNGFVIVLLILAVIIVPALPIVARQLRSHNLPIDYIASAAIALTVIIGAIRARHGSAGTLTRLATVISAILFFTLSGLWAPTLNPVNSYTITMDLQKKFPDATFVFRGEPSLPMVAAFDRVVPAYDEIELAQMASDPETRNRLICLDAQRHDAGPPLNFDEIARINDDDESVVVYAAEGSVWDTVP